MRNLVCLSRPFLALTGLLFSIGSFGQNEVKITPPPSEASSVFKFMEVPVSLYTGTTNISVPLHEIKLKGMTIPINLSYHSRGVRVDEVSPNVGAGWALNFGGMLSRQTRGLADDYGAMGFLSSPYYNGILEGDPELLESYEMDCINGTTDQFPDVFFFEMNGQSGKFTFDAVTDLPVQQKLSDIKITYGWNNSRIESFVLVDDKGNTFYYGTSADGLRKGLDYDQTASNFVYTIYNAITQTPGDGEQTISAWKLMDIKTPFGEHVKFFYDEEESQLVRHSYDQLVRPPEHEQGASYVAAFFSTIISHQFQLSRIEYDNSQISFVPKTTPREDVTDAYALDKVQVKNLSGTLYKEYLFQYYYTSSLAGPNVLPAMVTLDPKSGKRMFLSSVQERGMDGKTKPPYSFDYNTEVNLPNRFSTSQDNWGFYNGKSNGWYLTFFDYRTEPIDRSVDITLSGAGILEQVTYPTGGTASFVYEQNVAVPPDFMNDLLYRGSNPTYIVPVTDGFLKHPQYLQHDEVLDQDVYVKSIQIPQSMIAADKLEFSIDVFPDCDEPYNDQSSSCHFQVWLESSSNSYYLYGDQADRLLNIPPGLYNLKVIPPYPTEGEPERLFNITLKWKERRTNAPIADEGPGAVYAPGKRIKKILYRNADNTILTKEYKYTLPNVALSTGVLLGLPGFFYMNGMTASGDPILSDKYGSIPGSPLTNLQGNGVGYSMVTEFLGTNNINTGKTEYEFSVPLDGGTYYTFPYHPPIDNEWLRGKPTITRYYENNGGTYTLAKKVQNKYLFANFEDRTYLTDDISVYDPMVPWRYSVTNTIAYLPLGILTGETSMKVFYMMAGTFDLLSTTETEYSQGVPRLTTTQKYSYNYQHHYQPQGTETLTSDGKLVFTYTTYPNDYDNGEGYINGMRSANLLAYPIEQVSYQVANGQTQILGGTVTRYKATFPAVPENIRTLEYAQPQPLSLFKFSTAAAGMMPWNSAVATFAPSADYRLQVEFDKYDSRGNLLQLTREQKQRMAYVWDYQNTLPVAEVKGAASQDIAFTSFEADGKGNWSFSGTPAVNTTTPSGQKAYNLGSGALTAGNLNSAKKYAVSYWTSGATPATVAATGGGTTSTQKVLSTVGTWTQFECELSGATGVSISGSATIDEARLYPAGTLMTTYTYDPLLGMQSAADANGKFTYYTYDKLSRIQSIKDHKGNILKYFHYNYALDFVAP